NAHSIGMPRRSDMARTASTLPSGSEPVSCSRRPIRVDLPWSTCPTMTSFIGARSTAAGCAAVACMVLTGPASSHIAGGTQALESVLALMVHGTAAAFGDPGGAQLGDDLLDR